MGWIPLPVFIYSKGQNTLSPWKQPTKAVCKAIRNPCLLSQSWLGLSSGVGYSATRLPWVLGIGQSGRLLQLEGKAVWPLMATADYIIYTSLSSVFRDNTADREECGHSVRTCDLRQGEYSLSVVQLFFTSLIAVNGFTACATFTLKKPQQPGRFCYHSQGSPMCSCLHMYNY